MTATMTVPTIFEYKKVAYNSDLGSRALSVLMYLADRANNKDFTCFPSISTIGKTLHISISTVKRAMKELLTKGFLMREARFSELKNGGQTSNLYTLVLPQEDCHNEEVVYEEVETEQFTETKAQMSENTYEVRHIGFDDIRPTKLEQPVDKPVTKQIDKSKHLNKKFLFGIFKKHKPKNKS